MNEPVVVASDQSGVYVRVAKGKIIYLNDSGIGSQLLLPVDWSLTRVVYNLIESIRKEIYNLDDVKLDLRWKSCFPFPIGNFMLPILEPSCCEEPTIKFSSDYVHKDPRVSKRDIGG